MLSLLAIAATRANWRTLGQHQLLNVWLGSCVFLIGLWSIKAGIRPGLDFHVLGATVLTLMFGPGLAFIALAIVTFGITFAGHAGWSSFGVNLLIMGALPVMVSYLVFRLADRQLPNHLFIYIFVDAFVGAGLAMAASGIAAAMLLAALGVYSSEYLNQNYLPYYILMSWSEAMLSGMAITLMTAYRPSWVSTFDDQRYLVKR